MALSSTDAEHVAEELVCIFSRIGIPEEILTDQGPEFMSQLLAEIYSFLPIRPDQTNSHEPIPPADGWAGWTLQQDTKGDGEEDDDHWRS